VTRTRWAVVGAVCIAVVVVIASLVAGRRSPLGVDGDALRFVLERRAGWPAAWARAVTPLGSMVVLLPIAVVVALALMWRRRFADATFVLAAVVGANVLQWAGKALVERPRPPVASRLVEVASSAFPSGHATQACAAWVAFALVVARGRSRGTRALTAAAAAAVVLAVGLSRVVLGAHWLTDVVAGWALGAAWVALLVLMLPLGANGGRWVRP
jgi:undecaprenyl-diphosphatase